MEFVTLSLPEAAYLYTGLALQALTRGALRHLPAAVVIVNTMVLLTRSGLAGDGRLVARALEYPCTSTLILILFWPEAVGRFGQGTALDATQVSSYAATQDPGARVVTAQDTGLVPLPLQGSAPLPAKTRLLQTHTGAPLTFQDLLPWGGTPLDAELALFEVTPGAQTRLIGLLAALGFPSGTPVRCHAYFQRVEQEVQAWIANHRTERGTPLSQVFQEELGWGSRIRRGF